MTGGLYTDGVQGLALVGSLFAFIVRSLALQMARGRATIPRAVLDFVVLSLFSSQDDGAPILGIPYVSLAYFRKRFPFNCVM